MPDRITDLIHHPYAPPEGFASPQPGVFKASTVIFPHVAAMRARDWRHKDGYTYGLHGTPTTFLLEARIASLEGGSQCVLVPSGLAAMGVTPDLFEQVIDGAMADHCHKTNPRIATRDDYAAMLRMSM
jgi:cystathionine beta-lyase